MSIVNIDFLEQIEGHESIRAFAMLFARCIAENPDILLEIQKAHPIDAGGENWAAIRNDLQDDSIRTRFRKNLIEYANSYDWSPIEAVYIGWGKYGWITAFELVEMGFWDILPKSQMEADQKVLQEISEDYLLRLRSELEENTHNSAMFKEACFCFDHQCYYACSSLLLSLIDGVLTSTPSNIGGKNRRTGEGAGKKLIEKLTENDFFGSPGYFNLEIQNYKSFLATIFARANGFEDEPLNLNRNYLHHGMSNRTMTRADCIKLFIAYRKTIELSKYAEVKG